MNRRGKGRGWEGEKLAGSCSDGLVRSACFSSSVYCDVPVPDASD